MTATSHKAIHNLLDEVIVAGAERRRADPRPEEGSERDESVYDGEGFENTSDNADCADSDAPIVAGTSWLFAREEMAGQFDYLFIDEAGQVSLADAVAMSPCARNLVLLGDPQQLPHVTQGIHPGGAGVSVLEHLLGGRRDGAARTADCSSSRRGGCTPTSAGSSPISRTRAACSRRPTVRRQRIDSAGLSGTGLRYLPVEHTGNSQQSHEEAGAHRRRSAATARRPARSPTATACVARSRRPTSSSSRRTTCRCARC